MARNREDRVIQFLKKQLEAIPLLHAEDLFPVTTAAKIRAAERKVGFELPPLLKRIYLEIGNGGRRLGPGFGLLGIPGGYDNDDGWNVVKTSLEMAIDLEWWEKTIVICDWGCAMRSCVDCGDVDFPVYRWDGNEFDERTDAEDPSAELWSVEEDTFEKWLMKPNRSY